MAFTSSNALPAVPPETLKSSYDCSVNTLPPADAVVADVAVDLVAPLVAATVEFVAVVVDVATFFAKGAAFEMLVRANKRGIVKRMMFGEGV